MTTDTVLSNTPGDAQAIIDVTRQGVAPVEINDGTVYAFVGSDGVEVVDGRAYSEYPIRKTGRFTTFDAPSFVAYATEQAETDSKVWVDDTRFTAVAVLNGHLGGLPGHGDHRVTLQLRKSDQWETWLKHDGQLLNQTDFAELIEDNAPDIIEPSPAEMLELAQSFQARTRVDFESTKQLADGRRSLEYKETIEAKAGQRGQIEIPGEFHLALRPFIGSEIYRIIARFRYRINNGNLVIGYKLTRPADVQRSAFDDIIGEIKTGVEAHMLTVLNGTPA